MPAIEETIRRYRIAIELATDSAMSLLLRKRIISEWTHDCGLRYWTLFNHRPLSEKALLVAVAMLRFAPPNAARTLITGDDIRAYFPQLARHGLPNGYYVDRTVHPPTLGHVRVDAFSRISRIVARTMRFIDQTRSQTGFCTAIDAGRFELTAIVPTTAKARRLQTAFATLQAVGIPLHVMAMPELLNLIAPIPQSPLRV